MTRKMREWRVGTYCLPAGVAVLAKRIAGGKWIQRILVDDIVLPCSTRVGFADQGTMRSVEYKGWLIKFAPSLMYSRGYKGHPREYRTK